MSENKDKITNNVGNKKHSRRFGLKWIIVPVALAALGVGIYFLNGSRSASYAAVDKNENTFVVKKDELLMTVSESGSIRAKNTTEVKSAVQGNATIVKIVPEGTIITKEDVANGKLLVELDSSKLIDDLSSREVEIANAEASYADANESYKIQVKQNESDITQAELNVKFALIDLNKYLGEPIAQKLIGKIADQTFYDANFADFLGDPNLGGDAKQRLDALKDEAILADSQLKNAELTYAGTKKLFDANYVAKLELDRDELETKSLAIKRSQAETDKELFRLYEFPKQTQKLVSGYYEAIRELERTEARARSKLAQAKAQLQSAKASLDLRNERLANLKQQVAACIIKAPSPGFVIYGSGGGGDMYRRMRQGIIAEGGSVFEGQVIISLPDTAEMVAEIGVHESAVVKVQQGQSAEVVVDAFPDKKLYGKVMKISQMPDQERGFLNPDLKIYTTVVSIDGTYDFLKPGMSVKVTILIRHLKDVIAVPIQSIVNRAGEKYCYCVTAEGVKPRKVQTGEFNDTTVEITDGLNEGDEILLSPPWQAESVEIAKSSNQALKDHAANNKTEANPQPQRQMRPPSMSTGQFEMNDEMADRAMQMVQQFDPNKYEVLSKLRNEDPNKFKEELKKLAQQAARQFQQGQGQFPGSGQGQPGQSGEQESGQRRRGGQGRGQGQGGQPQGNTPNNQTE